MLSYIARRILLMIPTLLGIMLISFAIVQFAPGGPVERIIAQLQGQDSGATSRITGGGGDPGRGGRGGRGGGVIAQLQGQGSGATSRITGGGGDLGSGGQGQPGAGGGDAGSGRYRG